MPHLLNDTNNFAYGRWVTPVDDYEMHNVMALISPYVMVTLCSPDLNRLVAVVQQLCGRDPKGNELWDDSKVYKGLPLDFVDNDGGGACQGSSLRRRHQSGGPSERRTNS